MIWTGEERRSADRPRREDAEAALDSANKALLAAHVRLGRAEVVEQQARAMRDRNHFAARISQVYTRGR